MSTDPTQAPAPEAATGGTAFCFMPEGEPVTLADCPVGLFLFDSDTLGLKTEYATNEGRIDAFIVSTGEFFWGMPPQTITSQRKQIVQPLAHVGRSDDCSATTQPVAPPSDPARRLCDAIGRDTGRSPTLDQARAYLAAAGATGEAGAGPTVEEMAEALYETDGIRPNNLSWAELGETAQTSGYHRKARTTVVDRATAILARLAERRPGAASEAVTHRGMPIATDDPGYHCPRCGLDDGGIQDAKGMLDTLSTFDIPPLSEAAATLSSDLCLRADAIVSAAIRQAGEGDRAVMLGAVARGMAAARADAPGAGRALREAAHPDAVKVALAFADHFLMLSNTYASARVEAWDNGTFSDAEHMDARCDLRIEQGKHAELEREFCRWWAPRDGFDGPVAALTQAGQDGEDRTVIAISGGLGAGKEAFSRALADKIGGARVSFGAEVRRAVVEMGEDANDLARLQDVGQALVVNNCAGLIDRTLAQDTGSNAAPLVISGLRHVEVWCELRRRFPRIRLVHIDAPESVREQRVMERENVERRVVARYDAALCEVQSDRILPQYASVRINGALPIGLQVGYVETFLHLAPAQPAGGAS